MGRCIRIKSETEAWYHVHCRTAGKKIEFPLQPDDCQRKLIELLLHYCSAFCCRLAAFSVMGNHYHLVLRFDEFREMNQQELMKRALVLYPRSKKKLEDWSVSQWSRLNLRLYDLSELMRNVQASFARWYNLKVERKGRFWADRFNSTLLESGQAVLDCILYVDLNPVRAGLVRFPEQHPGTSVYYREQGLDDSLIPLQEVMGTWGEGNVQQQYRHLLYYRGSVASKTGQATIPARMLPPEASGSDVDRGRYLKTVRCFTDSVVLGGEDFVRKKLRYLCIHGHYLRRKHPIRQKVGNYFSLREQRSHAIRF